jgi:hypothetical protein
MSQNQKMDQEGESSSPVAVWPILFAFLPPLLSLVFGSTQIWGELLLLLVILFYLKYVLQGKLFWGAGFTQNYTKLKLTFDQFPGICIGKHMDVA